MLFAILINKYTKNNVHSYLVEDNFKIKYRFPVQAFPLPIRLLYSNLRP